MTSCWNEGLSPFVRGATPASLLLPGAARPGVDPKAELLVLLDVEDEAVHHLVERLLPVAHGRLRVGVEGVEGRVVVVRDRLQARPFRELLLARRPAVG